MKHGTCKIYHLSRDCVLNKFIFIFISDINECISSPCQNGGYCWDHVNNYTCDCQPGYVGYNCQIGNRLD